MHTHTLSLSHTHTRTHLRQCTTAPRRRHAVARRARTYRQPPADACTHGTCRCRTRRNCHASPQPHDLRLERTPTPTPLTFNAGLVFVLDADEEHGHDGQNRDEHLKPCWDERERERSAVPVENVCTQPHGVACRQRGLFTVRACGYGACACTMPVLHAATRASAVRICYTTLHAHATQGAVQCTRAPMHTCSVGRGQHSINAAEPGSGASGCAAGGPHETKQRKDRAHRCSSSASCPPARPPFLPRRPVADGIPWTTAASTTRNAPRSRARALMLTLDARACTGTKPCDAPAGAHGKGKTVSAQNRAARYGYRPCTRAQRTRLVCGVWLRGSTHARCRHARARRCHSHAHARVRARTHHVHCAIIPAKHTLAPYAHTHSTPAPTRTHAPAPRLHPASRVGGAACTHAGGHGSGSDDTLPCPALPCDR